MMLPYWGLWLGVIVVIDNLVTGLGGPAGGLGLGFIVLMVLWHGD